MMTMGTIPSAPPSADPKITTRPMDAPGSAKM